MGSNNRSLPLERKLPLLIFGLLAAVLGTSLALTYYATWRSSELAAEERLKSLTRYVLTTMETSTATRLAVMRRVARDSAVIRALKAPNDDPNPAARAALATLHSATDRNPPAQLWTPEGRAIGHLAIEPWSERREAASEAALLATRPDSEHVSHLFASGRGVAYWQIAAVRVDDELLGYVAAERHIAGNRAQIEQLRALVGENIDVYFSNPDNSLWTRLTGDTVAAPSAVRPLDSLVVYSRRGGSRSLASVTSMRLMPFRMSVEMPYDVILNGPRRIIRVLAAIGILLGGAGGLAAWLISRRLARPLVEVTGAAEALARGDYSRRVHANGTDEVGRLSSAFNLMADKVQNSHDSSARALRTQEFLGEAGRLLAGSFSDQTLIAELAHLCVPTLADYCSIHVLEDDGGIRRVETAHYDRAREPMVRRLVAHFPYRVDGPGEVPTVIRTQQPVLHQKLDTQQMRESTTDPDVIALLEQVGPSSFMCVPLIARGRAFGAMSFTMTDSGRAFSDDDVAVATELARRTAVAIDNAMIYRRSLALRMEAEAASQAKSDFLAKMSHEIRTPINAMMGYAELLEMGLSGPVSDPQRNQLSRIRLSGEHLTSLVSEILDLAKIEAGQMAVEPVIAKIGEPADAALSLVRPLAATKGVRLASRSEGEITATYRGDPQRVQQIIVNLLSNAVKFTPSSGSVGVCCRVAKRPGDGGREWACIAVEDTGEGIAPADQERIFHPFVQLEGGYTRAHGGTGLGLAISRSLAQMMGGELTVESAIGNGSCFTLWLPRA